MFLRRLFYASASILCLALAYHLGARDATAQAGSQVTLGDIDRSHANGIVGVVDRLVYRGSINPPLETFGALSPVPGVAPIVAVHGADPTVMLSNGDVYTNSGGGWSLMGNILGAATPAKQETWGRLKAHYR